MTPQHVIALATINVRRAERGKARISWEHLERGALAAEREVALNEATFILEALDAAGLHVAKVRR